MAVEARFGTARQGPCWHRRFWLGRAVGVRRGATWIGGARQLSGAELKKLRKSLGLSLAQAARQVEVSPRTWARWEAESKAVPEGAVKLFRILNKLERVK